MPRKNKASVAFQGEYGAFSFAAASKILGSDINAVPCESFKAVFHSLDSGVVTHAVLPIENTLHGSIHENYDRLVEYEVSISGETNIRISHQLIAMPGVPFKNVRRVFSHPVALNQCRRFFEVYKNIEAVSFYDTAGSVKMLKEVEPGDAAAIASDAAAEIYGGVILKRNIEDDRRNYTRFFLLTKHPQDSSTGSGAWKTSVVFSTPNEPGALFKAMACFALRDISLTKIESRPLRKRPWEYLFYLDVLGSADDPPVKNALANLAEISGFYKLLGTYRPTI